MEKITINHIDIGPTEYTVYTKQEADEVKIPYKYWQEAKVGEFAITNDNFVAKVIRRKSYGKGKTAMTQIKMPFGYILWNTAYLNTKFKAAGRQNKYSLTGKSRTKMVLESEKGRNLAMAYARTFNRDLALDLVFPGGVDTSQRRSLRRRMKTETFVNMVREELDVLLQREGLTESFTLELLKYAIDIAKGKKDVAGMLKAVENLQSMHGMKDKRQIRSTMQLEATETRQIIDDIAKEERRIIATEIIEKEDDSTRE